MRETTPTPEPTPEQVANNEVGVEEALKTFVIPETMSELASVKVIERAEQGETFWVPSELHVGVYEARAKGLDRGDLKFLVEEGKGGE